MYIHCFDCNWSQDDFWDYNIKWKKIFQWKSRPFGYNPLSILLEDIAEYWKPRYIIMDSYWAKEKGLKSNRVHSWWFIKNGFRRYKNVKKSMVYKTYDEYEKARKTGTLKCPKCGSYHLDID